MAPPKQKDTRIEELARDIYLKSLGGPGVDQRKPEFVVEDAFQKAESFYHYAATRRTANTETAK